MECITDNNRNGIIYTYDGTFDGFLCCVFTAYSTKRFPGKIARYGTVTPSIFDEVADIQTDRAEAERVYEGIRKNISGKALYYAYLAFMTEREGMEDDIFEFLRLGFKYGGRVLSMMNNDTVLSVVKLKEKAYREADKLFGFLRFEELEGGIYYAELEPDNNILELLAKHFEDRFPNRRFIICDKGRGLSAVYDARELTLLRGMPENLPPRSESEAEYRRLWKVFYDAVEIKERHNPKLRRSMMPKKYHKYITELRRFPD